MPRQPRYNLPGVPQQTCYRYIELNPVRAESMEISHPGEYPWSSYRANALGERNPLITPHPEYHALGVNGQQREQAYRTLFDDHIDDRTLDSIRHSANECRVLGGETFKDQIEAALARRVRPGKPGRLRKLEKEEGIQREMPV